MGKGTDLWDDSALINAFDHAMATYKEMHSNGNQGNTAKGKQKADRDELDLAHDEKTVGKTNVDPGSYSDNISGDLTEADVPCASNEVAFEALCSQGNISGADVRPLESEQHSSGFPCSDEKIQSSSDQQSVDYDQLLRQYYDLEEQKQKVVEQLYQANYWNYQVPVQSAGSQVPQISGYNASEHGLQTTCSLCSCHCVAVPLIPSSACAICGPSSGCYTYPPQLTSCLGSQATQVPSAGTHFPSADGRCSIATLSVPDSVNHSGEVDNAVKVGMLAVERAINSMKMEMSESSDDAKETKRKDISSAILEAKGSQNTSLESDLSAVLNAWYLAGFHTGRYLSEQTKNNASR